jgi:phosphoglycolate phosphatase
MPYPILKNINKSGIGVYRNKYEILRKNYYFICIVLNRIYPAMNEKYDCDLLIFDLDGTLIDTVADLAQAVNYCLRSLGFKERSFENIRSFIGDGVRNLLQRAFASEDVELIETALENFRVYYRDHLCDYSQIYSGIDDVLDYYEKKKLAILTNKTQEFADELLKKTGLFHRFQIVIGGGSGYAYKPDPESIMAILNRLKVAPTRAMIIGDSPNDVKAGKSAGIRTCAASYGYNPQESLYEQKPDIIIDHPRELKQYV